MQVIFKSALPRPEVRACGLTASSRTMHDRLDCQFSLETPARTTPTTRPFFGYNGWRGFPKEQEDRETFLHKCACRQLPALRFLDGGAGQAGNRRGRRTVRARGRP